jgi:ribosomal protein L18E
LTVRAHKVSDGAKGKIEAAGGTVDVIVLPTRRKTKRAPKESQPVAASSAAPPA